MFSTTKETKHYKENYVFTIFRDNLELDYYGAKDTLVDAIDSYIREIAPSSVMNGLAFVNKCDEYNMDLFFVVAQAQVESSFATKGLGQKMNSAFCKKRRPPYSTLLCCTAVYSTKISPSAPRGGSYR